MPLYLPSSEGIASEIVGTNYNFTGKTDFALSPTGDGLIIIGDNAGYNAWNGGEASYSIVIGSELYGFANGGTAIGTVASGDIVMGRGAMTLYGQEPFSGPFNSGGNIAMGEDSLLALGFAGGNNYTHFSANVALGLSALSAYEGYTAQNNNTAVGVTAGADLETGRRNTFLGAFSGIDCSEAYECTFVGEGTSDTVIGAVTRSTAIGAFANITKDNQIVLGTASEVVTVPGGLEISETGSAPAMGVATLVGGTVTVPTTRVTANSRIFLTVQTPGGAQGFLDAGTRVAGTNFTITSTSGTDTSTVAWLLAEPA